MPGLCVMYGSSWSSSAGCKEDGRIMENVLLPRSKRVFEGLNPSWLRDKHSAQICYNQLAAEILLVGQHQSFISVAHGVCFGCWGGYSCAVSHWMITSRQTKLWPSFWKVTWLKFSNDCIDLSHILGCYNPLFWGMESLHCFHHPFGSAVSHVTLHFHREKEFIAAVLTSPLTCVSGCSEGFWCQVLTVM